MANRPVTTVTRAVPTSAQRRAQFFEDWKNSHPAPECRAYGHDRRETCWAIPTDSRYILAVRYCGRGCGWSQKAVLWADDHSQLATFGQTYGDDYLKPTELTDMGMYGPIPRRDFHVVAAVVQDDTPEELVEQFERWRHRQ